MAAPQQVGASRTTSNTPVFYVPAPGQPYSAFAAGTSAWTGTRSKAATAVFNQRLKQMVPQDQAKLISDTINNHAQHIEKMAATGKDNRASWVKATEIAAEAASKREQGNASRDTASVTARGALRNAELDYDQGLRQMQELKPEDSAYRDSLKAQLADAIGPGGDATKVDALLREAFGGLKDPEDPNSYENGKLSSASPAAKQALSRELHGMLPPDSAAADLLDTYLGAEPINDPDHIQGVSYDAPGGGKGAVTSRNLGAGHTKAGEAEKYALDVARSLEQQNEQAPGVDPSEREFADQIASLRAENGRIRPVDFNAPLIRDEGFARPWDAIEESQRNPGGSGTEYGNQFATTLKSALQRSRGGAGLNPGTLTAGLDQRRSFTGPISTPTPAARGVRFAGGRDAAQGTEAPPRGAGGHGGAGAGRTDIASLVSQFRARGAPAWQGPPRPGKYDDLDRTPIKVTPAPEVRWGVDNISAPSGSLPSQSSGAAGSSGYQGPDVLDRLTSIPGQMARLADLAPRQPGDAGYVPAAPVVAKPAPVVAPPPPTRPPVPSQSSAEIAPVSYDAAPAEIREPSQSSPAPVYKPNPADIAREAQRMTNQGQIARERQARGQQAPEQIEQAHAYNEGDDSGGGGMSADAVHVPKVKVVPYQSKRGTTPYVPPAAPARAAQDTGAPPVADGQSLLGAIEGAGQSQQQFATEDNSGGGGATADRVTPGPIQWPPEPESYGDGVRRRKSEDLAEQLRQGKITPDEHAQRMTEIEREKRLVELQHAQFELEHPEPRNMRLSLQPRTSKLRAQIPKDYTSPNVIDKRGEPDPHPNHPEPPILDVINYDDMDALEKYQREAAIKRNRKGARFDVSAPMAAPEQSQQQEIAPVSYEQSPVPALVEQYKALRGARPAGR